MAKKQPELTKEQKVKQQLIDSIRALTNYKFYTLGQIEKTLKIPQNTLSGMLNESRNMAPKWQTLLTEFIKALPKEDKTITIKIDVIEPKPESRAIADALKPKTPVPRIRIAPPLTETVAAEKTLPAGLTKSQQIRWHREKSQTLK